jgi:inosine-uridine nucleoside N-ribohydrolase
LGAEKSLSKELDIFPFFNIDGLGGSHELLFKNEIENLKETFLKEQKSNNLPNAASKIVELVNQYPNEITIIALAPLTNLALALKECPDPEAFTKKIKRLIIMGIILKDSFYLLIVFLNFKVEMSLISFQTNHFWIDY